jgi:hypothetical protein
LTWPALVANKFNYKYKCYATPGAGNLQILEQILTQASLNEPSLFVVGWTWIDRFDYYLTEASATPWRTIVPGDTDELARVYYRDLHSEYRDKFTSLSYIRLAIDILKQNNIPFIMTYMDQLLFDQQWHTSPAVIDLQNYIQPHMTTFEGQSFLEWSRKNGHQISEKWHPLENAHQSAGDYILKFLINKV